MTTESESEILVRQALSHLRVAHACLLAAVEDEDTSTNPLFDSDTTFDNITESRDVIKRHIRMITKLLNR
jgi:hypothetical protein